MVGKLGELNCSKALCLCGRIKNIMRCEEDMILIIQGGGWTMVIIFNVFKKNDGKLILSSKS